MRADTLSEKQPRHQLGANPVRDFVPSSRPGARLPHAWVRQAGERCSLLDLVAADGLTLITGPDGDGWRGAFPDLAPVPLRSLVEGTDFLDADGTWRATSGIGPDGALLVRPDQHVLWRAATASDSAPADLRGVLRLR